jgi:hypothetical protein
MKTATIRRFAAMLLFGGLVLALVVPATFAQQWRNADDDTDTDRSAFRPIEDWPDPNDQRNAAGSPGPDYWQQEVDYAIQTSLDTTNHVVSGSGRITYHNNSPDELRYFWVQLDQNVRSLEHSRSYRTQGALPEEISPQFRQFVGIGNFDGGYTISRVQLVDDGDLVDADYRINDTVMKVKLPEPLQPGEVRELEIDWSFPVPDNGRGAKELVSDGWLYEIAQWFPRMSVYDDVNGWQTDQFLGRGEFYLNFGNYDVQITVPANHIVNATGVLQNPDEVLTETQQERIEQALQSEEPTFILRPVDVMTPGSRPKQNGTMTLHFKAENVRDFECVSSKTYVWDAAGFKYRPDQDPIHVYSYYPRDAMPLWDKASTRATVQTLKTYGRMAFEYPYPKVTNVHGPVFGMEYPMIAFCGARPQPDGSYSDGLERALIGVTIHEVGHNWFPMIVASDERKWTWMDEGLNTFLQYYGEQDYAKTYQGGAWTQTTDGTFPSRRGPAPLIVDYMREPNQVPIMTQSDLIQNNFGNNGYAKPAAGLLMLRENIVGEEAFDEAFREYSEKWMFKHPQPADFFRTMEEGTGEYLPWFWRGWFYTNWSNDQALTNVTVQLADSLTGNTDLGQFYYRVKVENEGRLMMPIHIEVTYDDGTTERFEMPVDVWRGNELEYTKGFFSNKQIAKVELDPDEVFADVDRENNVWETPAVEVNESGGE